MGFRTLFSILMIVNVVNSVIAYHALNNEYIYFICIQMTYFVVAGIFSLFPTPVAKTFGPKYGPQIYTIVVLFSTMSGGFTTAAVKILYDKIGPDGLFYVGTGFAVLSLILNLTFNERLDIEEMDKKGLIVWGLPKVSPK